MNSSLRKEINTDASAGMRVPDPEMNDQDIRKRHACSMPGSCPPAKKPRSASSKTQDGRYVRMVARETESLASKTENLIARFFFPPSSLFMNLVHRMVAPPQNSRTAQGPSTATNDGDVQQQEQQEPPRLSCAADVSSHTTASDVTEPPDDASEEELCLYDLREEQKETDDDMRHLMEELDAALKRLSATKALRLSLLIRLEKVRREHALEQAEVKRLVRGQFSGGGYFGVPRPIASQYPAHHQEGSPNCQTISYL